MQPAAPPPILFPDDHVGEWQPPGEALEEYDHRRATAPDGVHRIESENGTLRVVTLSREHLRHDAIGAYLGLLVAVCAGILIRGRR